MIKAEEINRWIENANSFCYKRETCKGCPLVGEAEHGDYCRWEAGDMTQEQVDMITAYEPYVDWSNVPVDTKVVVWNDGDVEHRQYFAKYDDGRICTYLDGATSWSRESGLLVRWKYGRLAEDDELRKVFRISGTCSGDDPQPVRKRTELRELCAASAGR